MTRSALALAAADYLNRGLAVIALTGKMPNGLVHRHGLHEPIVGPVETDEDWQLLADAFDHKDTTGVGIVLRWPYAVIDIDGEEGAQQYYDLIGPAMMSSDQRWVAQTGRGLHLWYHTFELKTGTIKLGPKLDLKSEGGYVVAPPSAHPDGGVYKWLRAPDERGPDEVPAEVRKLIEDRIYDLKQKAAAKTIRSAAWGPKYAAGDTVFYAQAGHDAIIEAMKTAPEGNRNNYLHWAAMTLAEEGAPPEEYETLAEAALAVGLDSIEVTRTLRSARAARG